MNVCDNLGDHLVGNVYVKVPVLSLLVPRGWGIAEASQFVGHS